MGVYIALGITITIIAIGLGLIINIYTSWKDFDQKR
jgi:hypothetical protein